VQAARVEQLTALALQPFVQMKLRDLALSKCEAVRLELALQMLEQPAVQQI
jgi:hypothetical protein